MCSAWDAAYEASLSGRRPCGAALGTGAPSRAPSGCWSGARLAKGSPEMPPSGPPKAEGASPTLRRSAREVGAEARTWPIWLIAGHARPNSGRL